MEPKPGYQSSQLYVAVGTLAAGILNKKLGLEIDPVEMASLCALAAGYIAHRHFTYAAAK